MPLTSVDAIIAAPKQHVSSIRTASRTTVSAFWFSTLDLAGSPGAGVLAGTSTTTGVVPTDMTAGFPPINDFAGGGGVEGRIEQVSFSTTNACRMRLSDLLWKGGAYAFNAAVSGQTPTSFASRVQGGTNFGGLEIWYEQVTAGTGIPSVNVTYINQDGVAGRSTGVVVAPAAMIVGRCMQLPLQAGDSGVQGVTGVTATVATGGTFNILVTRPLWRGRVLFNNDGGTHGPLETGRPLIFADSAVMLQVATDGTTSGTPEVEFVVSNG